MPLLALSRRTREKTAYDNVIDLLDMNPHGWLIQGGEISYDLGDSRSISIYKGDWKDPIIAGHRRPTRSERKRLLAAMDRLMAAKVQKAIDEHEPR